MNFLQQEKNKFGLFDYFIYLYIMSKIEHIIRVNTATNISKSDVILVNGEAFTYKNQGLTRIVFVNKDKTQIVKIPLDKIHQIHNDNEAKLWEKADETRRAELAETTLLPNGYVVQEYLQTLDDADTEKILNRSMTMKEIRFATSCRNEVGFDKTGKLKCYDYDEYKKY